jgi:uncharacterized protein (UPF0332 family)
VTPEAGYYLAKAHGDLDDARKIFPITLPNVAARSAYHAAFPAAEALIVEKTGRVARTHRGVRSEFARLSKNDPRIPKDTTVFSAQANGYKEFCDYGVDPDEAVTMEANAESAFNSAANFLDCIAAILA